MRLGICAGHSIVSPGVVAEGETEQAWCRKIVDIAGERARSRGWEVVDPRSDGISPRSGQAMGYPAYLLDRIRAYEKAGVDLAIDVHLNASRDAAINHSLVIHGPDRAESHALAQALAEEFARGLPWPSRGAVPDADLGRRLAFVRRLACPSVIVEPLFLSNPAAMRWLKGPRGAASLAEMIIRGVQEWRTRPSELCMSSQEGCG